MPLWKQRLFARLMAPAGEADGGGSDVVDPPEEPGEVDPPEEPADPPEEEVVVTIGDQEPPQDEDHAAPDWVREVRKTNRELQKENRELKAKLTQPEKPAVLGDRPKLADFDFDEDKHEAAVDAWHALKSKADAEAAERDRQQKEQAKSWQERLDNYGTAKTSLKVPDFAEAEDTAREVLSVTQQGIILQGATNPALVVYALGKNPDKAKELAAIKDPVQFTFAVARLETQLKTTTKKPTLAPEKVVTGSGRISGVSGNTLETLRAEAEKTGDYSKVIAYKKQKRA